MKEINREYENYLQFEVIQARQRVNPPSQMVLGRMNHPAEKVFLPKEHFQMGEQFSMIVCVNNRYTK